MLNACLLAASLLVVAAAEVMAWTLVGPLSAASGFDQWLDVFLIAGLVMLEVGIGFHLLRDYVEGWQGFVRKTAVSWLT